MKEYKITGGGGAQLHVVETGNSGGRPLLFIHGFSQCWLAWSRQINSALAGDYRIVAMDPVSYTHLTLPTNREV